MGLNYQCVHNRTWITVPTAHVEVHTTHMHIPTGVYTMQCTDLATSYRNFVSICHAINFNNMGSHPLH